MSEECPSGWCGPWKDGLCVDCGKERSPWWPDPWRSILSTGTCSSCRTTQLVDADGFVAPHGRAAPGGHGQVLCRALDRRPLEYVEPVTDEELAEAYRLLGFNPNK